MNTSYCPYCHGLKSMMLGDVYCSLQHQKSMDELATGTLLVKSKVLEETAEHISRLSIRCMLRGEQHYRVGGNDFLVDSSRFLVVNEGQNYQTSFSSDEEQEMILVAFQPGFAESLFYSLTQPPDVLLDEPFHTNEGKLRFFEKTYEHDPVIFAWFHYLRRLMDVDVEIKKTIDLDAIYTAMFTRLIELQRGLQKETNKLRGMKPSTRTELFRRLCIAKDFMDAHTSDKISLQDIAKVACLSVHHFKREFKRLHGDAPHHYLIKRRMERARHLLTNTSLTVEDVAWSCGFESESSFIRQFKFLTGFTPGSYRRS